MRSSSSASNLHITEYAGIPAVRLANETVEVFVTVGTGPRILCYRLLNGRNILRVDTSATITTELGEWRPYGGHRLWIAPEASPGSYAPDSDPVDVLEGSERAVSLRQEPHPAVGFLKELSVQLAERGTGVEIAHRITNATATRQRAAAWGITQMAPGGEAVVPQEPFRPHSEYLLPARPLVVWHYTDLSDPRWRIDNRFVRLRPEAAVPAPQKAGVLNKQGWAGYLLDDALFVKRFPFDAGVEYPDYGCNCEVFAAADLIEVESLGGLASLEPGQSVEHVERWELLGGAAARALLEA
jgi:hypothetical protein